MWGVRYSLSFSPSLQSKSILTMRIDSTGVETALAELLAQRILARDVPANLIDNRLWSLDIPALHAGASYKGQFEERIKSVLDEVEKSTTPIVLFIDEMHLVSWTG